MKTYKCEVCGNVVAKIVDSGVPVMCCGKPMVETDAYAEAAEKVACDADSVVAGSKENYTVCNCNNVSYFDILDEVEKHSNLQQLLDVFEEVKNTTKCSTGCGGCYDKVIGIISEAMS